MIKSAIDYLRVSHYSKVLYYYINKIKAKNKDFALKSFYTIILIAFTANISCGQSVVQFPTPNAASLGIFGQYPQSSFIGVPAINVPLYDFSYQGLSLPIQLNYNTNLVKPNQPGSWVGLGWNLTTGGAINRVVNGKPDDLNWYTMLDWTLTRETSMGYFFNSNSLTDHYPSLWTDSLRIKNALFDMNTYSTLYDMYGSPLSSSSQPTLRTIKDYAPDEFSFSVADLSGTFYRDDQGGWKVRSKNKVKVITDGINDYGSRPAITIPGYPPHDGFPGIPDVNLPMQTYLNRITLLDDRGISYVFGGAAAAEDDIKGAYDFFIKTWYLTAIVFPNGKSITFTYESGQTIPISQPSYFLFYYDNLSHEFVGSNGIQSVTQLSHPSYLKQIHTDLQDINFFRSENTNEYAKLDSIHVNSIFDNNKLFKSYSFAYLNAPMNRLKLSGIVQKDGNGGIGPSYSFLYNAVSFLFTNKNTDHWGYYNTKALQIATEGAFYNSREADTLNCRAELLDRIIYPTGGYTQYTWEPNNYSKTIDSVSGSSIRTFTMNRNAGGVRIKQVNNYDKNNIRTGLLKYSYTSGASNISSGLLYALPQYLYNSKEYYVISAINPLTQNNFGSHISYSEVTETGFDGGNTKITFSNFDTGVNNEFMDDLPARTIAAASAIRRNYRNSNSHERGLPLRIRSYLNTGTLLSEKLFTYARIDKGNEYVKSYVGDLGPSTAREFNYGVGGYASSTMFSSAAVKLYTNAYLPASITEIVYDKNNSLASVNKKTTYTYDAPTLNLKSVTIDNSKGDSMKTVYNYPYDKVYYGDDEGNVFAAMLTAHVTSPVAETITFKNSEQRFKTINKYLKMNNMFKLKNVLQIKAGTSILDSNLIYKNYDSNGNVINLSQPGGADIAYQWGYNKTYPIVMIKNAAYSQQTVNSTVQNNVTTTLPKSSTTTYSATITIAEPQTINVSMEPIGFPGANSKAVIGCSGPTGNFNLCLGVGSATCSEPSSNSIYLSPGSYTFYFTYQSKQNLLTDMSVKIGYTSAISTTGGANEFYFENFEESPSTGVTSGLAHTGNKFMLGPYTVQWAAPNSRNYVVSYWYRVGGVWKYSSDITYTGTSYALSGGDAYDDIRICPTDAQMTTYTYAPLVGITSLTDAKGETTTFEYDSFQRLKNVKNKDGNIVKHIDYHYQGQ